MASSSRQWRSRDEFKKAKELEDARKAGTVAPEQDEEGNDINPHIPAYIREAPWYLDSGQPSLKHQRYSDFDVNAERHSHDGLGAWYARGQTAGPAATKYRPGSCKNCGAMTHEAKFCTERPRKLGAKFTGDDIRPDEIIKDVRLDYAGKRDRWNGYDPEEYKRVIELYERTDQERLRLKAEEQAKKFLEQQKQGITGDDILTGNADQSHTETNATDVPDDEKDDFLESGDAEGRIPQDSKSRATVSNLRIREDTAKYLYNLNPDSAHYDAKTRSMRGNPNPDKDDATFKGDNFVRMTGDAQEFYRLQKFAWEAEQRGELHHAQAIPSLTLQAYKEAEKDKESTLDSKKSAILEEYGGAEHLDSMPTELILAQTEQFVEYTSDGRLVQPVAPGSTGMPRSRYEEDVFWSNHTSVWGSYWRDGQWGYACCHQMIKNSYCTGPPVPEPAVQDAAASVSTSSAVTPTEHGAQSGRDQEKHADEDTHSRRSLDKADKKEKRRQKDKSRSKHKSRKRRRRYSSSSSSSSSDSDDEPRRHRKSASKKSKKGEDYQSDERKRKYNASSGGYDDVQVTEKDMETYQRHRDIWDDPMRKP